MSTSPSKRPGIRDRYHEIALQTLGDKAEIRSMNNALRILAKWRAQMIRNTIVAREGTTIANGPFQGMDYDVEATEGGAAPRLLGCYEASLAPIIEEVVETGYPLIYDVGSAEGYYAVWLARRMVGTTIRAYDVDPKARARCKELAQKNGVERRVEIRELCEHTSFADHDEERIFVLCDIEGGERDLLDPAHAPGLRKADILVETHPGFAKGVTELIENRFAATHEVMRLDRVVGAEHLPDWTEDWGDLDRLLALWEWRATPTPWLWMKAR